jgi:ABC-type transporter Mla MlaB component
MLRISEINSALDGRKLRLDGSLTGPWVQELKLTCEPLLAEGEAMQIDCGGVSFVDATGIALLQGLQARGAALVNCSPFIKLQLAHNGHESSKH